MAEDELFQVAQEILHLQERQKIRLFLRRDPFARFVSCLVYVPRERYNTEIRRRFQEILRQALGGTEVEYQAQFSELILARIQFIVRTPDGIPADLDAAELEARLVEAARSWTDRLYDALIDAHGEEEGTRLLTAYGAAMPAGYQAQVTAREAVPDIDRLEQLARGETDLAMSLYRSLEHGGGMLCLKLARKDHTIALSDVLPVLENMGLRVIQEQPYEFVTARGERFWLHDFRVQPIEALDLDIDQVRGAFQDAFAHVWHGEVESDGFNQLVLHGLDWRQITVLRAYCKYLLQTGIPFSQAYMEQTLARNPALARQAAQLFETKFDPDFAGDRQARLAELEATFRAGLDAVANLDEDRILRRYMRLVLATLRTNYYQRGPDGAPHKPYLSLKIDPAAVPEMPLPLPAYEIFVYAPRTEGVHLRGGKVARGGIRWSDRREDFRTEVLGLMKAQMVKNCVIVPVGAKGGFVVKRPPRGGDRAALQAEVVACYQTLIRGMLDLTDNRVGDRIVPPERVVRFDDDDPYLVVAADKGTATFSDIANAISQEYGHWLGDAFASGGSAGYDHKGMGITARGAWELVKRHFLELGRDCQTEPFSAIGIGDMSGDVFGNGMLLSEQIRLIAAFDHRHIFIDPDPDPAVSYAERAAPVRAAALQLGRLRPQQAERRRRDLSAQRQVDQAVAAGAPGARGRRRGVHPARADPRDPARAGRPVLERRHRHLCQGRRPAPCRGVRSGQRRGPGQRRAAALPRRRRGRQSRLHAEGPDRVRPEGRAHQHRLHRQLGRGRLLGSRGQHQDPARCRGRQRRHDREAAQPAARDHDRRGRGAGAAQQHPAGAGDLAGRGQSESAPGQPGWLHPPARGERPAEPRAGGAARRRHAGAAPADGPGAVPARGGGAARLRQDDAVRRAAGVRAAG